MFWDSSALVPLLLPEGRSAQLTAVLRKKGGLAVWWGTSVECLSAIYRRRRESSLSAVATRTAIDRLDILINFADLVLPSDDLKRRAGRLLSVHPIRAADAFQLAAALVWCEENPKGEEFVSLDERLSEAANSEGFTVVSG